MKMISIFIVCATLLLFGSCTKDDISSGKEVALFLLESFETIDNSCQIDQTTVVTTEDPLLNYSDFLSYNSKEHTFKLTDHGKDTIMNLDFPVTGLAFAVRADNELIYTGYFWPGYSSASCQWIVTDPIALDMGNEIKLRLGYPAQFDGVEIPDKRNDPRIIAIFRGDNKLVE